MQTRGEVIRRQLAFGHAVFELSNSMFEIFHGGRETMAPGNPDKDLGGLKIAVDGVPVRFSGDAGKFHRGTQALVSRRVRRHVVEKAFTLVGGQLNIHGPIKAKTSEARKARVR